MVEAHTVARVITHQHPREYVQVAMVGAHTVARVITHQHP
jgi:hypothetical protein